jgi:hypothetical protein
MMTSMLSSGLLPVIRPDFESASKINTIKDDAGPSTLRGLALLVLIAAASSPSDILAAERATRIAVLTGFDLPETFEYDSVHDVYYVSNMVGLVTDKDNNGFISRIDPRQPDHQVPFIVGGRDGVTLHGPKGMAVHGHSLWVADIDTIRVFETRSGKPVREIDLHQAGAISLNDLTLLPDETVYVTDPRLLFGATETRHEGDDRVFVVSPAGTVRTILTGDAALKYPNGVEWDRHKNRILLAPLARNADLVAWQLDAGPLSTVAHGPGGYDGLEVTAEGRIFVSSLDKEAIFEVVGDRCTR